ncbi:sensor domain-containing diguanylate cyclase [Caldimonas brevitalea]|uniref:diguanylate cyclase n=1 Tax=Caldimonas brevitalea TaxID=413882 RepID=A0A0G3BI65_9BURK|nr:GGDEF domain-containing protein [Caldimonas brevitalea]AKJ29139.1 diguanylate cyclase [Caldimonas brevitalea]
MNLDSFASTIGDSVLAAVLLGLFIFASRLSPGLRGIALWGWCHFFYTVGSAIASVAAAAGAGGRTDADRAAVFGAFLACLSVAGLAASVAIFVRQRPLRPRQRWGLAAALPVLCVALWIAYRGDQSSGIPAVQSWCEVVMLSWMAWALRRLRQPPYRVPARLMQAAASALIALYLVEWTVQMRVGQASPLSDLSWSHADVSLWFLLNFCMLMLASFRAVEAYQRTANLDPLTGVLNRRGLEDALLRHATGKPRGRHDAPALMVLAIDLDHFKRINDSHGHAAGDAVLRAVAQCLQSSVRAEDAVGRLGGEEFVVVGAETDPARSLRVAERVRERAAALRFPAVAPSLRVTVSIGVACGPREAWQELLARADEALYQAKGQGRNRVVAAQAPSAPA